MASSDDANELFNDKDYEKSIPVFEYWLGREYEGVLGGRKGCLLFFGNPSCEPVSRPRYC